MLPSFAEVHGVRPAWASVLHTNECEALQGTAPCSVQLSAAVILGCEVCLVLGLSTLHHGACKVTAQGLGAVLELRSIVWSLCSCHKLGCEDFFGVETLACWSRQLYRTRPGGACMQHMYSDAG